jgi:ABC-type branched-subunit amino acid transport system substrate-binding protein
MELRRRLAAVTAVGLLAMVLVGCAGPSDGGSEKASSSDGAKDTSPITIGVILPTSGPLAGTSKVYQSVAEALGTEKIPGTDEIDGRKVKVVLRDDLGTAAGTASALRQLIDSDHAEAIIGPLYTGEAQAALPLIKQKNLLSISLSGCPDCGDGTKFPTTFSVEADRPSQMASTLDGMEQVGAKAIAMLQSDDPTGQAYADAFSAAAKERGVEIVKAVHFAPTALDLGTQAAQLKASGADAVYLASAVPTQVATAAKAMREAQFQPYVFGNAAAAVKIVADAAGPEWVTKWAASGYGKNATRPDPAEQATDFAEVVEGISGEVAAAEPINLPAGILDGFNLIKRAIEANHTTDGTELAQWLVENGYPKGIKAPYEFTDTQHNGMKAEFQALVQPGTLEHGIPLRFGEQD